MGSLNAKMLRGTQELSEMDRVKFGELGGGIQSTAPGAAFSDVLSGFVDEVSQKQATASAAVQGLQSGQNVPVHQAMLAMEEASVSFQMMVEVRNKLMDAYQELMRMQI